ncbi:MAG: hypothetical protein ACD_44C00319G0001 [uncultured bacterium]|nr:MAG: hypothetical protein ACD_44C00319G0001 [uncultured bacterium]OGT16797.1 MAG: RnfH family protein [Gammaproteobacteria bacterium RIFCSPHIGHO2_02_FULL_38_33]OGT23147.1 MAG: RnfH family protein [Gammaproteobacteria bacterium RIFCSPHIGHO2_12_38_15]OGT67437.1 MAG: RnfH family protein [Gammaproteobacteria bacterium RIFCSPLOWO2_02_FULL_38_11]OGT78020.1 MAG: RnfH family protein [Gammaproteobacteria bacterium RIFCSPLOWO2_12_FULL_38_14]
MEKKIQIEIVYALADKQTLLTLEVSPTSTAKQALEDSGILKIHPEICLDKSPIGIFGKKIKLSDLLKPGDRLEIYRPLQIDPKKARKLRH